MIYDFYLVPYLGIVFLSVVSSTAGVDMNSSVKHQD
jgi:hypothetical protein